MFFDEEYETNKDKPLPQKEITIRLAHAPDGRMVKFVRNSNYFGEWKKGVFAGEDYRAKLKGDAIFLHAGCRKDTLETHHGPYQTSYSLFVALSANGKTSTTCKVLARKGRERSWLIQDDGGTLYRDGRFRGFEAGGLFIKTDGLNPGEQIEAYYACLKRRPSWKTCTSTETADSTSTTWTLTSNGRAVVERRDFMHAAESINAKRVDNLFIITRGGIIPAIAKLTPRAGGRLHGAGAVEESSAGDPTQAGKIKNEFFYDPFIAGDPAEHANLFYDILKANAAHPLLPAEHRLGGRRGAVPRHQPGRHDGHPRRRAPRPPGALDDLRRHRADGAHLGAGRRFDPHEPVPAVRRSGVREAADGPRPPAGRVP